MAVINYPSTDITDHHLGRQPCGVSHDPTRLLLLVLQGGNVDRQPVHSSLFVFEFVFLLKRGIWQYRLSTSVVSVFRGAESFKLQHVQCTGYFFSLVPPLKVPSTKKLI